MPEVRDFDYVFGKLPRKDKDGKDTTGDKIGKGGRHRDDGTFSSMAYDLEVVDRDLTQPIPPPPPRVIVQRETVEVKRWPVQYEDPSLMEQIIFNGVGRLVDGLLDCVGRHAEDLLDNAKSKIISGIENWSDNRRRRKEEERLVQSRKAIRQQQAAQMKTRDEQRTSHQMPVSTELAKTKPVTQVLIPDEFDSAYEQFSINMTSEEAQKELLDAFVLYVLSAKKVWRVSHAKITNSAGNITDGKAMIEKLSNPSLLESINQILEHKPALLEEWQSIALTDILGHSVIENDRLIPIDETQLRKALTANNTASRLDRRSPRQITTVCCP